jgi:hypothetical protein
MMMFGRLRGIVRRVSEKYRLSHSIDLGYDPYDQAQCEAVARNIEEHQNVRYAEGSLDRCRQIIEIIGDSFPTERLTREYFSNLDLLLARKDRSSEPGQLVFGMGAGRCGSTSLAALLATVEDSCCTHENPPLIFWSPRESQISFHKKRFAILTRSFSLVADVAHWWLNAADQVLEHFPQAKAIGLMRDPEACAESFMRIKGYGLGSYNHWAAPGNGVWRAAHWDPTYPTYDSPDDAVRNPDRAKLELITRYVKAYNASLAALAHRAAGRMKLVRTETLGMPETQAEIFSFINLRGKSQDLRLNINSISDGRNLNFKF